MDKDGRIDYHELKVALRALGFDLKKAEVLKILRDNSADGMMTVDVFHRVCKSSVRFDHGTGKRAVLATVVSCSLPLADTSVLIAQWKR